ESQKANREDVKAEFRKKQENPKEAIRQERKRDKAATLLAKETADLGGQDYERLRSMNYSIEDVERWEEKEREKEENADKGFTDHAQVQARKYNNLIRSLKPNLDTYTDQKAHAHIDAAGDNAFFPDANSLAYANPEVKTSSQGVQRVVADLKKQNEKRATFSRRREFNEDDDVTYINERNMHFNKKISRAYDKYTAEIKANFERGTAL
ncbi:SYF2 splicing factor-domain-containing protein, partial [Fimicolochytrium jonesii]|uniref:SYF2 splicing factor-domain-containing protein n=1 Tax=Fimicolochytrium jonesii TaxID=1396493 RepID=UPI0022FE4187